MAHTFGSSQETQRAFTFKSILFGLLGILFISGLAGFHDNRMPSSPLMVGTHLPVGGYFFIVFVALVWNLIFSRLFPALVLNPKELVVVMGMTLVGCFPPTSGLFRYFQRQVMLPWYYLSSGGKPDWESLNLFGYLPLKLFPHPVPHIADGVMRFDETVYRGFFTGLAKGNEATGLSDVPFGAWLPALMYWGPLLVLMCVCIISLSLFVHRQWSSHEQLSYPLAQVAGSMLRREKGKGIPDVFRSRLFWWGFVPVLLLYLLEYMHLWFPETVPGLQETLPSIKEWRLSGFLSRFPIIRKVPPTYLSSQTLFYSIIAIAYFAAPEISFTMGVWPILLAFIGAIFFGITGTPLASKDVDTFRGGAYIGYALILLYTGRAYYLRVLKLALGMGAPTKDDRQSVLAAWLVVLSFSGFVAMLVIMGMDWLMALFFSLLLMLLFLVFTRIICETGIPLMQAGWWPGTLMVSLFGPAALGPGPLIMALYFGSILCLDPRECLMPYAATSLKLADDAKVRVTKTFWVLIIGVVAALVIGFVSTTWTLYNFGALSSDNYASAHVPTHYFDDAARQISLLKETGSLEESSHLSGLGKLKLISPNTSDLGYIGIGLVSVVVFSLFRFRFNRFPLHPVLFLVIGTYPAGKCWSSFLLGWAVKSLVVRFGGGRVYQKLKPLFIGLIAGELISVGASVMVDLIYYMIAGEASGIRFNVMVQ